MIQDNVRRQNEDEHCHINYSVARYVSFQRTLSLFRYPRNQAFHFWIRQFEINTLLLLITKNKQYCGT